MHSFYSWVSKCVSASMCVCVSVCLCWRVWAPISMFEFENCGFYFISVYFFSVLNSYTLSCSRSLDPLFCFCLFYSIIHRVENYILLNHLYGIIHEATAAAVVEVGVPAVAATTVATAMDIGMRCFDQCRHEALTMNSSWEIDCYSTNKKQQPRSVFFFLYRFHLIFCPEKKRE